MTMVTIDDKEYDTSDFTEDQNNMVAELQYNSNIQRQLTYELSSLKAVGDALASRLKRSLTENEDVTEEAA
tara:strand:- start:1295 stop:1507 length:213 start_codon:yes stop_codon:yes gene_type:complete